MFRIIVIVLALAVGALTPDRLLAEYCRPVMPDHASDATGFTFRARVAGVGAGDPPSLVTLNVQKVYANAGSKALRVGKSIQLYSNACDGFALLGFAVGDEILISSRSLTSNGPSTWNTAVWRVADGRLHLLVLDHSPSDAKVWYTNDRRIADAHTVREALALVAPGAGGFPETATDPASGRPEVPPLLVLVGLSALLLTVRRCRRAAPRSNDAEAFVSASSPPTTPVAESIHA
jgi:hypothetical protein